MKDKINKGEVLLGTMISEFAQPNLLRVLQVSHIEFVILDCEHGPFDFSQLAAMIAVGNGIHMPVIIRIPAIERGFITKVLDMGADGLLVPMVNTAGDARKAVEYAKYAPIGKRGVSTTRAHTNYNPPKFTDYIETANKRVMLMLQIETREAVANASNIAAVDGVDALIIGPSDLSMDLGICGELMKQEMLSAVDKVTRAALEAHKACGTVSTNMSYLAACRKKGMSLFCVGSELNMVQKGAAFYREAFMQQVGQKPVFKL